MAQLYEHKLESKLLGLCDYKLEVTQLDLSAWTQTRRQVTWSLRAMTWNQVTWLFRNDWKEMIGRICSKRFETFETWIFVVSVRVTWLIWTKLYPRSACFLLASFLFAVFYLCFRRSPSCTPIDHQLFALIGFPGIDLRRRTRRKFARSWVIVVEGKVEWCGRVSGAYWVIWCKWR